jgi:large subunit ribosomal protein L10
LPSKAKLESHKQVVKGIADDLKAAKGVVLVDYRGITVSQDTELRTALRNAGVKYRVVKNTMTTFAVRELGYDELEKSLTGPTAMATSETDLVAPARVLSEYEKKIEKLQIKAGIVEGRVIGVDGVKALAALPSKEVLVSTVLGTLKAPINGLVNVLNGNIRGLVCALNAIAEQRQTAERAEA